MSADLHRLGVDGEAEVRNAVTCAHGILASLSALSSDGRPIEGLEERGAAGAGAATPVEQLRTLQQQYLAAGRALRNVLSQCEEEEAAGRDGGAAAKEDPDERGELQARAGQLREDVGRKNAEVLEGMARLRDLVGDISMWQGQDMRVEAPPAPDMK